MNEYFTEIGYKSLIKNGEELCGDKVVVVNREDGVIVVLADGLGSGVKANILATLCSTIVSTMMSAGMSIENCVATIASTLPVCSVRGVAYSTFTIIRLINDEVAEIFRYDNPDVIFLRDGEEKKYHQEELVIDGKKVYYSKFPVQDGDLLIALSDGAIHAGVGRELNFGWELPQISDYIKKFSHVGYTAKTLSSILLEECDSLYGGKPGDDTTACTLRIRKREQVNLLIGPPTSKEDCSKMMSLFFSKAGKHIVCGGTTSKIAADFLGEKVEVDLTFHSADIPPIAKVKGIDLVTEGVITINKVLDYAKDYVSGNDNYSEWGYGKDGASLIATMLFEEATDINFYVGRAINPAHQNPGLPINFNIKMNLVAEIADYLGRMGKNIKVSYF